MLEQGEVFMVNLKNPICEIHNEKMYLNGYEKGHRVWKCKRCLEIERNKLAKMKKNDKKFKILKGLNAQHCIFFILLILIYTLLLTSFGGFL